MSQIDRVQRKSRRLFEKPKPVIERWMRLRVRKKTLVIARFIMRWRLPLMECKRKRALEGAFLAVSDQCKKFEKTNYSASKTILNASLYFLLIERDIQALKISAMTHPDEWTRKLHSRMILLTIHEWKMEKVTGRPLRQALEVIGASDELKRQVTEALREIRSAQEKVSKVFLPLRNSIIAHRDADALIQFRAIRDLDPLNVLRITGDFYSSAGKFLDVLPRVLVESTTIPGLLRQLDHENSKAVLDQQET